VSMIGHGQNAQAGSDVVVLTRDHLDQAHALSQALKWPYRLEDWQFALDLGQGYAVERDGCLVGTALWWRYGPDFASAGMIIVDPAMQKQGIGARLMDAMLRDASGFRMILNSTIEGRALYTRLGFESYGEVTQHQAILSKAPAMDRNVTVRAALGEDHAAIREVDRAASGMDRDGLIVALLAVADTVVVERNGAISGYGMVRRWGRGVVIGPVIARDETDARAIIAVLASAHEGNFVRIDTTQACGLAPWLVSIGLPQVDKVVAMSLGAPPCGNAGTTLFTLSNQSLG
jgi:GNAT superfamily N-acetyltransferase